MNTKAQGEFATAVAKRNDDGGWSQWQVDVGRYLGLRPESPATPALFHICQRYGLDPLAGHVILMQDRKPYITRDGLLHIAHASGQLDGIEVVTEPELVDTELGKVWRSKVAVYRKDMSHPFIYPGRYANIKAANAPEMSLKTAESMSLRRAFSVTGIASADERDGIEPEPWQPEPVEVEIVAEDPPDWGETAKPGSGIPPKDDK